MIVNTHSGPEPLDENKINAVIEEACVDLPHVDWAAIASRCSVLWYDGIPTDELAECTIMATISLIEKHPNYEFVAARLLLRKIYKQVKPKDFKDYIAYATHEPQGPILQSAMHDSKLFCGGKFDLEKLQQHIDNKRDKLFRYQGVKILYDRYLIKDKEGSLLETPQWLFMRVAMGIALAETTDNTEWAIRFYDLISQFDYMPSTPTLFNAGTTHPQMASCYVQHVEDSLDGIFTAYNEQAKMSKWAGGIGTNWSAVRASGARIAGTNGNSSGLIPWLKIQNDIAIAVNQGGKRRGSHCAYLEPWHLDIEEFLDLRKPIGDERRRTHDLDTALWLPDLFMEAVKANADWHLFSPDEVPELANSWGVMFQGYYREAVEAKKYRKVVNARGLWKKMLNALFETGHPWICFKDACNRDNPMKQIGMIKSSNLCTEIMLNTSVNEIAVCNLGSINLANHIIDNDVDGLEVDYGKLEDTATIAVRMLDNVIDGMFYPDQKAWKTNVKNRPLGLGIMGWQELLFKLGIDFDGNSAFFLSNNIQAAIAASAYNQSIGLAESRGRFPNASAGTPDVRNQRNSHLTAIAPTVTISNIVGTTPSIEPLFSNLYVKSNMSGDFTFINRWLVDDCIELGIWDDSLLDEIKFQNGSIQNIARIPQELKDKYKTAFEIPPKVLIDLAAARQPHVCQSQSLNLYVPGNIKGKELSDIYMYAWEQGLKTTYYLRTQAASSVEKSTIDPNQYGKTHMKQDIRVCNLDEGCESCQ